MFQAEITPAREGLSGHPAASLTTFAFTSWASADAGVTGDPGSIPGVGGFPGEGNGSPLQYSCLGSPMDRGAWRAAVHGVPKSWT